jgi:Fur family iron response transcriptional regulator
VDIERHNKQLDRVGLAALLRQRGIAPTPQRLDIAEILLTGPQHLAAEEVLNRVNRTQAAASKATVYNTLGLFARKGLVREVIVDPARIYYDSNTAPHHHFYHVDTGELEDIPIDALSLPTLPDPPPGTTTVGVEVTVRVCSR